MIYITGDTHRYFSRLYRKTFNKDDMLIILGDAGINYCLNEEDGYVADENGMPKEATIKTFCKLIHLMLSMN